MRRTDLTIQAAEEDYQLIVQKINDMLYRMISIVTDNVRIEKPYPVSGEIMIHP